jgi:hypothetical protein
VRPPSSRALVLALGVASLVARPPLVAEQQARPSRSAGQPVRYQMLAVRTVGVAGAEPIEIVIHRWSSDAEHAGVLAAVMEKGPDALLDAIQDLPEAGRLTTAGSVGVPLGYARRGPAAGGGEHVQIITDRPMSFAELWAMPRSTRYPLMYIEMTLNSRGQGDGTLTLAARISWDRFSKLLVVENYETEPIRLQGIRRED